MEQEEKPCKCHKDIEPAEEKPAEVVEKMDDDKMDMTDHDHNEHDDMVCPHCNEKIDTCPYCHEMIGEKHTEWFMKMAGEVVEAAYEEDVSRVKSIADSLQRIVAMKSANNHWEETFSLITKGQ